MSIIPSANSNLFFRMNSIPPEKLADLEYIYNKYDNITAVREVPGLSISRHYSRKCDFDCNASFYREDLKNPFIQWHFLLPGRMHYQKDIVLKRLIGSSLAGAMPPANFIFSHVNIREISRGDLFSLVRNVLLWCVDQGGKYISPYCDNSAVVRNWLNNEYGQANVEFCAPTIAVNKIPFSRNDFLLAQAEALIDVLLRDFVENSAELCIVGFGNFTYQLTEALLAKGLKCVSCVDIKDCSGEVLILASMPNCINAEIAGKLSGKILVELMPEQVDPDADAILQERGCLVLPEFFNDISIALLEKFWERRENLFDSELIKEKLKPLLSQIFQLAESEKVNSFTASALLAQRGARQWLRGQES